MAYVLYRDGYEIQSYAGFTPALQMGWRLARGDKARFTILDTRSDYDNVATINGYEDGEDRLSVDEKYEMLIDGSTGISLPDSITVYDFVKLVDRDDMKMQEWEPIVSMND